MFGSLEGMFAECRYTVDRRSAQPGVHCSSASAVSTGSRSAREGLHFRVHAKEHSQDLGERTVRRYHNVCLLGLLAVRVGSRIVPSGARSFIQPRSPIRSIHTAVAFSDSTSVSFIVARVAPTNNRRTAASSSFSKSISVNTTQGDARPLKR